MSEIVRAYTAGGVRFEIDVTACVENGQLDESSCETTSDVLAAVQAAIRSNIGLDLVDGSRALIGGGHIVGYVYTGRKGDA